MEEMLEGQGSRRVKTTQGLCPHLRKAPAFMASRLLQCLLSGLVLACCPFSPAGIGCWEGSRCRSVKLGVALPLPSPAVFSHKESRLPACLGKLAQ